MLESVLFFVIFLLVLLSLRDQFVLVNKLFKRQLTRQTRFAFVISSEEGVLECLGSSQPFIVVEKQQFVNQVKPVVSQDGRRRDILSYAIHEVVLTQLLEDMLPKSPGSRLLARVLLADRRLSATWHRLLCWCAADRIKKLKRLIVSLRLEQNLPSDQLSEHAPDGPHVDTEIVVLKRKQQLWCSVPERDYPRRVLIVLLLRVHDPGKTEISNLY